MDMLHMWLCILYVCRHWSHGHATYVTVYIVCVQGLKPWTCYIMWLCLLSVCRDWSHGHATYVTVYIVCVQGLKPWTCYICDCVYCLCAGIGAMDMLHYVTVSIVCVQGLEPWTCYIMWLCLLSVCRDWSHGHATYVTVSIVCVQGLKPWTCYICDCLLSVCRDWSHGHATYMWLCILSVCRDWSHGHATYVTVYIVCVQGLKPWTCYICDSVYCLCAGIEAMDMLHYVTVSIVCVQGLKPWTCYLTVSIVCVQGLKPWTCYICDYRTDLKGNLTKHLRTVHHLMVETNQKLCKVVSSAAATSHGGKDSLTATGCVNVNDMHMSKMLQSVGVMHGQPPCNDTVDVIEVPLGYVKLKECSLQTMSPSIESQQHGMLVGTDVNNVPMTILPDVSRPPDTSNMTLIYSMTNLASSSPSCDGGTDLVVMSPSVPNLAPLTSRSMPSSSLATTTMASLTPLPSISSSLGHLRHSSLSSLALSPAVNAPFPHSLSTSSSDTTTTLTPLTTHVPLPPHTQMLKDDSTAMLSALHMPTDPNGGFYMYADNQLIPSQTLLWEHANQDITQYRQQAYKWTLS